MSNNSELTAVASRDLQRGQAWANERGVANVFDSYKKMLASDTIDAAYVPLPNSLHKEWSYTRGSKRQACSLRKTPGI